MKLVDVNFTVSRHIKCDIYETDICRCNSEIFIIRKIAFISHAACRIKSLRWSVLQYCRKQWEPSPCNAQGSKSIEPCNICQHVCVSGRALGDSWGLWKPWWKSMRNNKLETTEWIMEVIMAWGIKGKKERDRENKKVPSVFTRRNEQKIWAHSLLFVHLWAHLAL